MIPALIVRDRVQGAARSAVADFATLDSAVVDLPVLRLDHRIDHRASPKPCSASRIASWSSTPFGVPHGIDENTVA